MGLEATLPCVLLCLSIYVLAHIFTRRLYILAIRYKIKKHNIISNKDFWKNIRYDDIVIDKDGSFNKSHFGGALLSLFVWFPMFNFITLAGSIINYLYYLITFCTTYLDKAYKSSNIKIFGFTVNLLKYWKHIRNFYNFKP
jgi:hypothetical protein